MSKNYELFKSYYERGLWSKDRLWNVIGKSTGITEEEYHTIVGV